MYRQGPVVPNCKFCGRRDKLHHPTCPRAKKYPRKNPSSVPTPQPGALRAFGYCRASKIDQENSIPTQKDAILRHYELVLKPKGYIFGGFYEDHGVSGRVPLWDRAAGSQLRQALERDDCLILSKLDRGFRSLVDLVQVVDSLSKRGIHLQALDLGIDTTTEVGKMIIRIMGAVAEWERGRIGERTREVFAELKRCGFACGTVPYGFSKEKVWGKKKRLIPCPEERAIGQAVLAMFLQGKTATEIAAHLTLCKVDMRGNHFWTERRVTTTCMGERRLAAKEAGQEIVGRLPRLDLIARRLRRQAGAPGSGSGAVQNGGGGSSPGPASQSGTPGSSQ